MKVGARGSCLSRAQVDEVERALHLVHPEIVFERVWVETQGDLNLDISLIDMESSDFFTKEIDELLLQGQIDAGIHSAKDLAVPLREGLCLAALTTGVDPSDVLVLREEDTLEKLGQGAKIGTSSLRRIAALKELREDLEPVSIRGTIERRLSLLDRGEVDGVILAEAALLRLKVTRKRIVLKGKSAPLQGKLAVVTRTSDLERRALFSCLYCAQPGFVDLDCCLFPPGSPFVLASCQEDGYELHAEPCEKTQGPNSQNLAGPSI